MKRTTSITTRTGDNGTTHLFSGERVSKDCPQAHAYGDLDEVVSLLGVARALSPNADTVARLESLQRRLFVVGAELATSREHLARLRERVDEAMLAQLDREREDLEAALPAPGGFILPGGTPAAAHIDLARAVTRRCERKVVGLMEQGVMTNETLLVWLNRLSDYLWLLARAEENGKTVMKDT